MYLHQGELDRAIELFNQALSIDPKLTESLAGLAKSYLAKNQPDRAVGYLVPAIQLESQSVKLHYLLGRALQKQGKTEEAEKEFAKVAQSRAPDSSDYKESDWGELPSLVPNSNLPGNH